MREEIFLLHKSLDQEQLHPDSMRITKSWASSQMPDWIPLLGVPGCSEHILHEEGMWIVVA